MTKSPIRSCMEQSMPLRATRFVGSLLAELPLALDLQCCLIKADFNVQYIMCCNFTTITVMYSIKVYIFELEMNQKIHFRH